MATDIIPFLPEHYMAVVNDAYRWGGARHPDANATAISFKEKGPAFTAMVNGEIAGVAGLMFFWPGLAEAWAVISALGTKHPLLVHRAVKTIFPELARVHKARRVQASVIANFMPGRRWAEKLDFQFESFMPKYGPRGEEFIRYVRFFGEDA